MSTNIIYCYSGSGNCLDMAKNIAKGMGDTDIVMMRSFPAVTDATAYKRVGFVFPCYGGGLPGDVESYVKSIHVGIGAYKFGVVQYAGYPGCGLDKIDSILGLDYWAGISQHCSCIWLMPHWLCMPPVSVKGAQKRSEKLAKKIAADALAFTRSEKKPPKMSICRYESAGFADINKTINGKFTVSDDCIGCGQCRDICPKGNISIENGRAVIGTNCIGCLSCLQYCPQKAINVGKITVGRERYHNANVKASDLTQKIIHID